MIIEFENKEIEKRIEDGSTKSFCYQEQALSYAKEKRSYAYQFYITTEEDGVKEKIKMWGVPK